MPYAIGLYACMPSWACMPKYENIVNDTHIENPIFLKKSPYLPLVAFMLQRLNIRQIASDFVLFIIHYFKVGRLVSKSVANDVENLLLLKLCETALKIKFNKSMDTFIRYLIY